MLRAIVLTTTLLVTGLAAVAAANDAGQQSRDLAASLDKTKYKQKHSKYVSFELFVDVRNEPAVKDPSAYSGAYEADGFRLDLTVRANGTAAGGGYDTYASDDQPANFTLDDAKIDGALLTGRKIYATGESVSFEAVFVNRTTRTGPSPDHVTDTDTRFGLGFLQIGASVADREMTRDHDAGSPKRVFLAKQ